jgi:hypothetical protein
MYRLSNSQEVRLLASRIGQDNNIITTLYNVSSQAYLALDYSTGGNFTSLTVSAFNDYSTATHNVEVEFISI